MKASKYLSSQAQIPEDIAADFCLWYHNVAVLRSQTVSNSLESISKALMKVAGSESKVSVNNQAALAVGVILCAQKCENTFIVDRYYAEACYTIAKLIVLIRDRSLLRELASFLETHRVPSKIKPLPIKLLEVLIEVELASRASTEALGMLRDQCIDNEILADRGQHWLIFNLESTVDAAPWYQSVATKGDAHPDEPLAALVKLLLLHAHRGQGP